MNLTSPIPARPEDFFSAEEVGKSKSYQRPLQYVRIVSGFLSLLFILAFITFKVAPSFDPWYLQLVAVIFVVIVLSTLVGLPLDIWVEFSHERKWGFSTQTPARFAVDQVKGILLGTVLLSVLFIPLWALIRSTPLWWLWGGLVFMIFSVGLAFLAPILLIPIFNKLTPLENEELKTKLMSLAKKGGIAISGFQVMDASKRTKKDNAFFAGMGKTRRVVLFDNMLEYPHEHIEVVVAHEIGHWKRGHIRKQIALGVVTSVVIFGAVALAMKDSSPLLDWAGVASAGDPASLPLFLLIFSAVGSIMGVITSWFSRWYEREADLAALELTASPDAYVALWRNMTGRNLPDLDPSWWARIKASHPPIAERMAFAEVWRKGR
ncbi:MAG: M48 family metallopeptidase [Actinomycetota bacterium]